MISKDEIEQMKQESAARRKAHSDWPSHKVFLHHPNGGMEVVVETMPIGKAKKVRGYCKFCYTTHSNWWALDPRESDDADEPFFLCGRCEGVSQHLRII
jgi:DNA-directed RNA polymerase subunit M/transcription elongation factor TFIIS